MRFVMLVAFKTRKPKREGGEEKERKKSCCTYRPAPVLTRPGKNLPCLC